MTALLDSQRARSAGASPLLEAMEISKRFAVKRPAQSILRALTKGGRTEPARVSYLHAVDNVSLTIAEGESVGLVGESGCGKSTLVRILARLIDPTDGNILFGGHSIAVTPARDFARTPARAQIQMVFQDAGESLNPRFTAFDAIAEPLRLLAIRNVRRMSESESAAAGSPGSHFAGPGLRLAVTRPTLTKDALRARVHELAELTGLPRELLTRFPHQLSGGQKARAGIARAIAVNPRLLVLDEPTSALDVSVQALILKLLADLRRRLNMSYLFVSHDLNVVRLVCDRVLVMYLGKIVEAGPAQEIFDRPRHPYTRALVSAVPRIDGASVEHIRLEGDPQSPIDPPPNRCRFYGRCPSQFARCASEAPPLHPVGAAHWASCHLVEAVAA